MKTPFLIVFTLGIAQANFWPTHFSNNFNEPNEEECSTMGRLMCDEDCQRIWSCQNISGTLKRVISKLCTQPETCNVGECTSKTQSRECSPAGRKAFVCQDEGMFPDPITCKKYHYCLRNDDGSFTDYVRVCKTNFYYNPRTGYCDGRLTNNNCEGLDYSVPVCKHFGQNGPLVQNPSIVYVCRFYEGALLDVLYPFLHLCPDGTQYDQEQGCT